MLCRNPLPEVHRFFEKRHPGHYRLYDLRGEKGCHYDPAKFGGQVARFGFFDHNPAPLKLIAACVQDIHSWLSADPANVAAIHCKAGKGRTGLIITCYLVFAGLAPTTTAALRFFGEMRTSNGKGVTIPSQMRYCHYFETSLKRSVAPVTFRLRHFRLHTVPNFDVGGGCDPYFDIRLGDGKQLVFDWRADALKGKQPRNYKPKHRLIDFDLWPLNILVKGDVKVVFYDWDAFGTADKMFHFWFNTAFVDSCSAPAGSSSGSGSGGSGGAGGSSSAGYLLFHKDVLDRACKDKACKEFEAEFKLELFMERVDDSLFEEKYGEEQAKAFLGGKAGKGEGYLEADNDDDMGDDEGDA